MFAQMPPPYSEYMDQQQNSPRKTQKILNKKGGQRRFTHKMTLGDSNSEIFSCKFDPTDKYLACGFGDGAVRIYNTDSGKCAFTLCSHVDQYGGSDDMPVCAVRWRPVSAAMKTANVLVSAQADGYLKHWHATSGRCLHQKKCEDNEENQLYTIDYNADGSLLATAGKDKYVRLYDEQTKSIVLKMKETGDYCGHSNRIFCVRFNQKNPYTLASGGWDNTIQLYDIRKKGPVGSIYGPHVCGDAIDFRDDGFTMLTGSYRQEDVIELWDVRTMKKFRDIKWDGPKAADGGLAETMEETKKESPEEDKENEPAQKEPTEVEGFSSRSPAPFIYACQFNRKQDMIMAGGAGANQVRCFDYETGTVLCVISDLPRAVLGMTNANTSNDFAFGSVDSKVRIFSMKTVLEKQSDAVAQ